MVTEESLSACSTASPFASTVSASFVPLVSCKSEEPCSVQAPESEVLTLLLSSFPMSDILAKDVKTLVEKSFSVRFLQVYKRG